MAALASPGKVASRTWTFLPDDRRKGQTRLTPFQSWIVNCTARHLVGVAARRSGKTTGVRARILKACLSQTPGDVGYMAPTLGQAKRLLWRRLMRDLAQPGAKHFVAAKNASDLYVEFVTGTRLYLYSAEAADRVLGEGFKLFVTDESDDPIYTDDIFDEIIHAALAKDKGVEINIGSPKGRRRLYKNFCKGRKSHASYNAEYASRQVTAIEAGMLDKEEIERARRTLPLRLFRQEYEAAFNAPIGSVYEEWTPAKHVVRRDQLPSRFDFKLAGVDWGEATRGAMLVYGVDRVQQAEEDGERPRVWAIEEDTKAGRPYTDDGWWAAARKLQMKHPEITHWYCDPAGGDTRTGANPDGGYLMGLRKALGVLDGQYGRPRVVAANNKVRPGISSVQEMLHFDEGLKEEPHLFVSEDCPYLIDEFPQYRRVAVKGSEDEFEEEIVKEHDHCLDPTRYVIHTHFFSRPDRRRREEGPGWGEAA